MSEIKIEPKKQLLEALKPRTTLF